MKGNEKEKEMKTATVIGCMSRCVCERTLKCEGGNEITKCFINVCLRESFSVTQILVYCASVSIPKLQSILQQIYMRRLGNIGAQLDDRKKERVQVLTLCPQALGEHTDRESQCQHRKTRTRRGFKSVLYALQDKKCS